MEIMNRFPITNNSISDLQKWDKDGELTLRPPYQRQLVWSEKAKVSLMETILLGFPFPEIFLAFSNDADGNQQISVVDGQQRCNAILEFIKNKYPLHDLENESLKKEFDGNNFSDLPSDIRIKFYGYRFPVRRLDNADENTVRQIFARINRVNMTLNDQEINNALLPGPFLDFLKDCANHKLNDTAGLFSGGRRNRQGDLQFYAEVFGSCLFGMENKRANYSDRYDQMSTDFENYRTESETFEKMLSFLEDLQIWKKRTRWSNIVDMYTLQIALWETLFAPEKQSDVNLQNISSNLEMALDLFQQAVNLIKKISIEDNLADAELDRILTRLSTITKISNSDLQDEIRKYTSGIRNSSDLSARRLRKTSITNIITRASFSS